MEIRSGQKKFILLGLRALQETFPLLQILCKIQNSVVSAIRPDFDFLVVYLSSLDGTGWLSEVLF